MFIDLHAHTSGISHCCRISAEDNVRLAKECGFDGLAIANHYTNGYFSASEYSEWIEKYIAEWELSKGFGEKYGVKIFKAIEVTMECEPRLHMLVYGGDEEFLRQNPLLCEKTLPELYGLCRKNGCALIQAHPFRGGAVIQDTDYLDGIEINCHPLYRNSYANQILLAAGQKNLAVTVGCDYHADTYRPLGGTYLPDEIKTDKELAEYILSSKRFELKIHEPLDKSLYTTVYDRK